MFSIHQRVPYIVASVVVMVVLVGLIVGLTLGLRSSPPENGGSPPELILPTPPAFPPSEMRQFRFASVSSDASLCAQIGTEILGMDGGTAVDASIAAMVCVGVVNAHSNGLGGGHFSLIYQRPRTGGEREMVALISRETAPAAAHRDMYVNDTASSTRGGKAVGIPGEVSGFYAAWLRYGSVPWEDLFRPTIKLLTEGYPVARALASAVQSNAEIIKNSPALSEVFLREDGEVVEEGDIIKDTTLARTMERVALDPFTFYNGTLARDIVADIADADGIITEEDLRNYEPKFKEPTKVELKNGGFTLYGPPPPSSGVVLQHIMQILDGYNLSPSDIDGNSQRSGLVSHRIVEAFKHSYAKRSALGDEDYWDVAELVKNMTSEDFAAHVRSLIDDNRTFNVSYYEPAYEGFTDSGTAHLGVIDQHGNAVGMTSTINLFFGSKVKGSRTGIVFNNEMDDFSTPGTENAYGVPASPSNFIFPGKRPMSSMAPSVFLTSEGHPALLIGGSGGTRITTQIANVAINNLWLGDDLKEATDRARLHHQLLPHHVDYERHNDPTLVSELAAKGHVMNDYGNLAVIGSIRNECDKCEPDCLDVYCIEAVADGRKGGVPDGF